MRDKFLALIEARRMRSLFSSARGRTISAAAGVGMLAISVNPGGGPGGNSVQTVLNWLAGLVLGVCGIGIVASAATWAIAHHVGAGHHEAKGKQGVVTSIIAAMVVGAAAALINFGLSVGHQA
jgi:hypothetical protein